MDNFWRTFVASFTAMIVSGGVLLVLGVIIIAGLTASIFSQFNTNQNKYIYSPKEETMLLLDLSLPIVESTVDNPIFSFDLMTMEIVENTSHLDVVNTIVAASYDDNISSIFLNLNNGIGTSLSNIDEIREALKLFKERGKNIYAYSDYYNQTTYYLASIANKIYLNPVGDFQITGLSSVNIYFKELLDKFDVDVEVFKYGKYKSAIEPYTLNEMSEASREQTEVLLKEMWNILVGRIADSRNITATQLNEMANNLSVSTPEEALTAGLVDELCYLQDLEYELKEHRVPFKNYLLAATSQLATERDDNLIEVIYADGAIISGESRYVGDVGDITIINKIERAMKDKEVKAIVLRVNSPGGSALASDNINHAIERAKKLKPVVVSMGASAASGGYYIACNADAIIAAPFTVTGSIGVFGMAFNPTKLLTDKVGLNFDVVKTNKHADMGSMHRSLNAKERLHFQKGVDRVYGTFINTVAKGRNMSVDGVDNVAQGRVWSAIDAKEAGLVDEIGGLGFAIMYAADMADLGDDYMHYVRDSQKNNMFSNILSLSGSGVIQSAIEGYFSGKSTLATTINSEIKRVERVINGDRIQALSPVQLNIQ